MEKRFYQILDVEFSMESSSLDFMDCFHTDFCWFEVPSEQVTAPLSIVVHLNGVRKGAFVSVNDKVLSLVGHPDQLFMAQQLVLDAVFEAMRDFLVLHAAVVAKGKDAVIIAGPSGVGKSTLTLDFLENGFAFLSDDFCPIHKETRLIHPFPRSLWVSAQSPWAALGSSKISFKSLRRKKVPIMAKDLPHAIVNEPVSAKCLIYLDTVHASDERCELAIEVREERETSFLKDLERIGELNIKQVQAGAREWSIRYVKGRGLEDSIKSFLKKYEGDIWSAYRVNSVCPDFEKDPLLSTIPAHEIAFQLIKDLRQAVELGSEPRSFEDRPGAFFMQLLWLLEGVTCYRLSVGRREEMKALGLAVVNQASGA